MTVLAWDGKTLAADRLACGGTMKHSVTKIARAGGDLIGICGNLSVGNEMRQWYLEGADTDLFPDSALEDGETELVVITNEGKVMVYSGSATPFEIEDEKCAFGSGAEAARAAMLYGANAVEAVDVASQINITCGNGFDALELERTLH
jgi:ATP-dependent protease HslVU (ClpYQ) peptidase subunit